MAAAGVGEGDSVSVSFTGDMTGYAAALADMQADTDETTQSIQDQFDTMSEVVTGDIEEISTAVDALPKEFAIVGTVTGDANEVLEDIQENMGDIEKDPSIAITVDESGSADGIIKRIKDNLQIIKEDYSNLDLTVDEAGDAKGILDDITSDLEYLKKNLSTKLTVDEGGTAKDALDDIILDVEDLKKSLDTNIEVTESGDANKNLDDVITKVGALQADSLKPIDLVVNTTKTGTGTTEDVVLVDAKEDPAVAAEIPVIVEDIQGDLDAYATRPEIGVGAKEADDIDAEIEKVRVATSVKTEAADLDNPKLPVGVKEADDTDAEILAIVADDKEKVKTAGGADVVINLSQDAANAGGSQPTKKQTEDAIDSFLDASGLNDIGSLISSGLSDLVTSDKAEVVVAAAAFGSGVLASFLIALPGGIGAAIGLSGTNNVMTIIAKSWLGSIATAFSKAVTTALAGDTSITGMTTIKVPPYKVPGIGPGAPEVTKDTEQVPGALGGMLAALLKTVTAGLTALIQPTKDFAAGMTQWSSSLDLILDSKGFKDLLNQTSKFSASKSGQWGTLVGQFMTGFAQMLEASEPLINATMGIMTQMMGAFSSPSAKGPETAFFTDLSDILTKDGTALKSMFLDLGDFIVSLINLTVAIGPNVATLTQVITDVFVPILTFITGLINALNSMGDIGKVTADMLLLGVFFRNLLLTFSKALFNSTAPLPKPGATGTGTSGTENLGPAATSKLETEDALSASELGTADTELGTIDTELVDGGGETSALLAFLEGGGLTVGVAAASVLALGAVVGIAFLGAKGMQGPGGDNTVTGPGNPKDVNAANSINYENALTAAANTGAVPTDTMQSLDGNPTEIAAVEKVEKTYKDSGTKAAQSLAEGFVAALQEGQGIMTKQAQANAVAVITQTKTAYQSYSPSLVFKNIGKDNIQGLINGMVDDGMWATLKNSLDTQFNKSQTIFTKAGKDWDTALAAGITDNQQLVVTAATQMAQAAVAAVQSVFSQKINVTQSTSVPITISSATGVIPPAVVAQVEAVIYQVLNEVASANSAALRSV